jgi:hypothetical protein
MFMFVPEVDEYADVHLVPALLHTDLADAAVLATEFDPQFQLSAITLPEPERVTELLRLPVRARRPPRAWFAPCVGLRSRGGVVVVDVPSLTGRIGWLRTIGRGSCSGVAHAIDSGPEHGWTPPD